MYKKLAECFLSSEIFQGQQMSNPKGREVNLDVLVVTIEIIGHWLII